MGEDECMQDLAPTRIDLTSLFPHHVTKRPLSYLRQDLGADPPTP
jgi:hypothetical protein